MSSACNKCCDFGFELLYDKPTISLIVVGHELTFTEKGYGNLTALNHDGDILWTVDTGTDSDLQNAERVPAGIVIDNDTNVIVRCNAAVVNPNRNGGSTAYVKATIIKYTNNGYKLWEYIDEMVQTPSPFGAGFSEAFGAIVVDSQNSLWFCRHGQGEQDLAYKLDEDGNLVDSISQDISEQVRPGAVCVTNLLDINSRDELMLFLTTGVGGVIDSSSPVGPVIVDSNKNLLWDYWSRRNDIGLNTTVTAASFDVDNVILMAGRSLNPSAYLLGVRLNWFEDSLSETEISFTESLLPYATSVSTQELDFENMFVKGTGGGVFFRTEAIIATYGGQGVSYSFFVYDNSVVHPRETNWELHFIGNVYDLAFDRKSRFDIVAIVRTNEKANVTSRLVRALSNNRMTTNVSLLIDDSLPLYFENGDRVSFTHNGFQDQETDPIDPDKIYYILGDVVAGTQFAISESLDGPPVELRLDSIYRLIIRSDFLVQRINPLTGERIWKKKISTDTDLDTPGITGKCIGLRNF